MGILVRTLTVLRVLLEILEGGSALSVCGDEAEEAWQVVMPVLEGWSAGEVPLLLYPVGSDGPNACSD